MKLIYMSPGYIVELRRTADQSADPEKAAQLRALADAGEALNAEDEERARPRCRCGAVMPWEPTP